MSKYVSNISNIKLKQIILVVIIIIVLGSSSIVSSGFLTAQSIASSNYKITATILNPVETIGSQQADSSSIGNPSQNSVDTTAQKAKPGKTESRLLVIKAPTGMGTTYPAPGSFTYTDGSVAKIYASPEPGWILDEWILDDSPAGRDNPVSVKMNKDHVLSAVFSRNSYSLSLSVAGSGATDPSGTQTYPVGSEARVTATPDPGWVFDHWVLDGAPAYGGSPVTVRMSSDHTLEAVFIEKQYLLNVLSAGDGGGSVVLDPPGGSYSFGSVVTLTADPAEGSSFSGWGGDVSGSANPATIVMDGNKTVTAAFDLVPYTPVVAPGGSGGGSVAPSPSGGGQAQYTVTVSISGQGSVSRSPSQSSYASGSTVQLAATPSSGWVFSGWSGSLTGSANPATLTVDGSKVVTATFTQATHAQYTLTIQSPVGSGITSPATGVYTYSTLTPVQVTAYPAAGYVFSRWVKDGGASTMTDNPTTIDAGESNRDIQAVFTQVAQAQYTLTVTKAGSGGGSVVLSPAGGVYASGTVVTLTASPSAGSGFTGWGGAISGSSNPVSVTVSGNKVVTATFTQSVQALYTLTILAPVGSGTTDPGVGAHAYAVGTRVGLTAYPASGWVFDHWRLDGVDASSSNPSYVTMGADRTLQAVFTQATQTQYTVTVTTVGQGSVSRSPSQSSYASGSTVQLTATQSSGWIFAGWGGSLTGSTNPTTVTMNENKAVTATFTQTLYALTVATAGSGSGSVTLSPAGGSYASGAVVTLTASPAAGSGFSGWSGALSGSANPITITMDSAKSVMATFTQSQYTLTIQSSTGSGSTNPTTGSYAYNKDVNAQVTATPSSEWRFDHWLIDDSITSYDNPVNIKMDSSRRLKAVFIILQYTLILSVSGVGATSPSAGTYVYDSGSQVQIAATPASGYVFSGWSGSLTGSANPATLTMDGNKAVTATFTQTQYTLTVATAGSGSGSVSLSPAGGSYASGTVVTLTATPASGYVFSGWSSSLTGSANPITVTMNGDKAVTAVFSSAGGLSPLHVEGKLIKDIAGNTIKLRGVNIGNNFVDNPGGKWMGIAGWSSTRASQELDVIKSWGANIIRMHETYQYWIQNTIDPISGLTHRKIVHDLATMCAQKGLYLLLDGYGVVPYGANGHRQTPLPWPPFENSYEQAIIPDAQTWINMWSSAAGELKDLPNVIIEPHNEPVAGDGNDWSTAKNSYFSNLQSCVNTIRSAGFNGLIVYQWDYGTWVNMDWPDSDPMSANAWSGTLNWVALFPISDPLGNLVISTHQYWDMGQVGMWTASHGGSDSNPTYPTSIADIKLALSYEGLQYVLNTLNKPIIIGELGWNKAWTDQSQMQLVFTNQLQAYNDLGINYTAFWFRSEGIYSLISSDSNPQPNLAGQILINKIAEP